MLMSKILSVADIMLLQTEVLGDMCKVPLRRQNSCCFVSVKTCKKGQSTSTPF